MTLPEQLFPGKLGGPIQKRRGASLPHWTSQGAVYSVTFRLVDSVPQEVLRRWRAEREHIVARAAAMERPLTDQEHARLAALYSERIESCLDAGRGACHLRDPHIAALVRGALHHFDGQRHDLAAWCVMPNHVHAIVRPWEGHELPEILRVWKGFTSWEANRVLGRKGEFWQSESYDHLVRDHDDLRHAIEYVLANPAKAGLRDWPWVGAKEEWRALVGL